MGGKGVREVDQGGIRVGRGGEGGGGGRRRGRAGESAVARAGNWTASDYGQY